MRKKTFEHTFAGNLDLRKRRLEMELSKIPTGPERDRIILQIKELEGARHMEAYLRSTELQPPK
jgi:hypothetical protein